ncbi:MAG: 4Fe-4S dicluster domain-containing protein [Coriobacteriales bacterium]|jgi:formate hydrogenlyase subunit 6/NADH:ubiquinone oxidoreductase subunit I|nr:4Fe-4S dicluster domain-containing protein [Coriobacteriales bacterium]
MGSFRLTKMSLRNLGRKPATRPYPQQPARYTPRTKGHIVNNIELCILCSICQKRCPATALTVNKAQGTWTINPFSCVQCGTCVRVCPKKSLRMQPEYTAAAAQMHDCTLVKPEPALDGERSLGSERPQRSERLPGSERPQRKPRPERPSRIGC